MKQLTILFFAAAILFSCSKDDGNNSTAITKENLVGSYKITSIKIAGAEFLDSLEACRRDDILQLNADNTVNYIDAGVKCDPAGDDTGTWDLSGNTLTLDTDTVTIKSFDGTHLIAEGQEEIEGFPVVATITFTKQ